MLKMKKNIIYFSAFASLLLVFFFWWDSSGQLFTEGFTSALLAMGRLYGLLAVYFVLWQFLLAGRMLLLETTFGLDTLSRIHQKNGKVAITFILLHPIFIILSYSMAGKISLWSQIVEFVTQYEDMLQAIIAVGLFVTVVCTSVYIARKHLRYETWYFVHLLTYLAVLLAYGHQLELGGDFVGNTLFTLYWYFLYAIVFGSLFFFRFCSVWEGRGMLPSIHRKNNKSGRKIKPIKAGIPNSDILVKLCIHKYRLFKIPEVIIIFILKPKPRNSVNLRPSKKLKITP